MPVEGRTDGWGGSEGRDKLRTTREEDGVPLWQMFSPGLGWSCRLSRRDGPHSPSGRRGWSTWDQRRKEGVYRAAASERGRFSASPSLCGANSCQRIKVVRYGSTDLGASEEGYLRLTLKPTAVPRATGSSTEAAGEAKTCFGNVRCGR